MSEDIDLVVLRREGESNNKLTTKIRQVSDVVNAVLPEVDIPEVTQKMGMNRKTAHTYAKEFSGDYGQVRDVIIVEATWLGYYEPYTTKAVSSFICPSSVCLQLSVRHTYWKKIEETEKPLTETLDE